MRVFARPLARLVAFLLLVVLAVSGLALAVFSIKTGNKGVSLGDLARQLQLPAVRRTVGHWLTRLEGGSSVALLAAVCGLGAMIVGIILLIGLVGSRRERLVVLEESPGGTLAARRRPLASVAQTLAEQAQGVTTATARIRPQRTGRRVLRVRATSTRGKEVEVRAGILANVRELSTAFGLRSDVDLDRRGPRVQ